jgi:UDP-N-acetylmuramate dehydrogenase
MNLISQIKKEVENKVSGGIIFEESLSKYSWFNLGGPAKVVFKPKNLNELSIFLKNIKDFNKIKVLGVGSNTLIRDGGYNGIIIRLGKPFTHLSLFDENTLIAGAAALDKSISDFALENSLKGFEFLSCIPGTIGGGIRMNSGCYGEDISQIITSVQAMDLEGKIKVIYSSDIRFSYRECDLDNNLIFISATFKGKKDSKLNIEKKINHLVKKKKEDQPSKIKTCGSTFKNPKDNKAWKLIKDSGCAGMSIGDAYISEKHCNFFVNKGRAKSSDLEKLIYKVKKQVLDKTEINLELELKIIGEEK